MTKLRDFLIYCMAENTQLSLSLAQNPGEDSLRGRLTELELALLLEHHLPSDHLHDLSRVPPRHFHQLFEGQGPFMHGKVPLHDCLALRKDEE